ncbi:hypothetical protein OG21DRAFT_1508289 [Imleria badia]|nr:hypothetical protein OG21DRAFT_1508289 [Imleria badia]
MYELPTLETLFTNFIPEADMPIFPSIPTAESHANPLQDYTMTPTEGFGIDWTTIPPHGGGLVATSKNKVHRQYSCTSNFYARLSCFASTHVWTRWWFALRLAERQVIQCPFMGCSDTLQWINIPRHIKSIHLGVRFRCPNCGKLYTRPEGLATHTASLKCYGRCLFGETWSQPRGT